MSEIASRTVTPNGAKRAIRKAIKVNLPIMLWGPAGVGKSDVVHQIAKEQGRKVIDVRLSLWDPTDIKGIPYYNPDLKRMCWAPPEELPSVISSTEILFLDELPNAPQSTQAAAYQLILNRQVGTYKLPDGVSIVAAGNREGDRGHTHRMPAPLANRLVHLTVQTDFDDWLKWANQNGIHAHVTGFISYDKRHLYNFDPKSPAHAFATPRSWSYVSRLLQDDDGDESSLHDLIAGSIGDGLAATFMAHRKVSSMLPKPEDVLSGKVTKMNVTEISAQHSMVSTLCHELHLADQKKAKDWNQQADNFIAFMMNNFSRELVVLGVRIGMANYELPFDGNKMKHFDEFYEKYGQLVVDAMRVA